MPSKNIRRFVPALAVALALLAGATTAQAAESYKIDGVHSVVLFKVTHLGVGHFYGRINDLGGTYQYDAAEPSRSSFDVSIKTDSVDTNEAKRDQHLKSPDFFNAKQFPVITFKSKSVKKGADGALRATGDLTLHGVTKEISVDVKPVGAGDDPWGNYRTGFETQFTFKRSDFGMTFMSGGLSDEIVVTVAVEGIRQ